MNNAALHKARAAAGGKDTDLARLLGISQSAVSQWKTKQRVPLRRALQIEALTGGQVTKEELRPDVFLDPGRVPEWRSDVALGCFPQPEPASVAAPVAAPARRSLQRGPAPQRLCLHQQRDRGPNRGG